jgi:hypothetical protein
MVPKAGLFPMLALEALADCVHHVAEVEPSVTMEDEVYIDVVFNDSAPHEVVIAYCQYINDNAGVKVPARKVALVPVFTVEAHSVTGKATSRDTFSEPESTAIYANDLWEKLHTENFVIVLFFKNRRIGTIGVDGSLYDAAGICWNGTQCVDFLTAFYEED